MEEGPLWNTLKKQLYKSEVPHIKRLVGEVLIQQNRTMWNEIRSLRSMFTDFQEQNDERSKGTRQQVQLCSGQHRDLLQRQAQILLADLRSQAAACGHVLEDMVPELKNETISKFLRDEQPQSGRSSSFGKIDSLLGSPPQTPSTRPSTASGVSVCSTPDIGGMAALPLGRTLSVEELSPVAEGIREALEAEHEALLGVIGEQMGLFEVEEARRADVGRAGPSTSELQEFVHKLQDLAVSPTLRTLTAMTAGAAAMDSGAESRPAGVPISGGASVRRLKALIAERRRDQPPPLTTLGSLPEASDLPAVPAYIAELAKTPQAKGSGAKSEATFDPFFDDPFA